MSSSATALATISGDTSARVPWVYEVVRTLIGLVLLAAALLKAHQLVAVPLMENRNWLWIEVGMEWLLSLWLLGGWKKNLARWVAIACFALFAIVAAKLVVQGASSCGCFGSLNIPPAITLGFDLAAIVALVWFRPGNGSSSRSASLCAVAVFGIVSLVGGGLILRAEPVALEAGTVIAADEKRIILEPATWIGKPLPLIEHLPALGSQLAHGKWIALLYHHDCGNCEKAILTLTQRHSELTADGTQLALIEVPPTGELAILDTFSDLFERDSLPADRDWIAAMPMFLWLQDGTVQRVGYALDTGKADTPQPAHTERRTEESPATPPPTSVIEAKELHHDLGYIEPASHHTVRFTVRNPTDHPMDIREAQSECSCMKAPNPPKSIPANGEAIVEVTFDAPNQNTNYSKRILLLPADSTFQPIELRLSSRIGLPLRVEPAQLKLGETPIGQTLERTITIYNDGSEPVKLLYATSSIAGCVIKVSREPIPASGSIELPIRITPNEKWRDQNSVSINIQTGVPHQPSVQVSILGGTQDR